VRTPRGGNKPTALPHGTSLFDVRNTLPPPEPAEAAGLQGPRGDLLDPHSAKKKYCVRRDEDEAAIGHDARSEIRLITGLAGEIRGSLER
jgi:hypothetical protein